MTSFRLFGVKSEKKEERVLERAQKTTKVLVKIGMKVNATDMSIAHRLGPYSAPRCRPITVKLVARIHKTEALKNRRKLKGT